MTKEIKSKNLPPYYLILILSALIVILVSCVLSPLYMQIKNDVILMYSVLPIVLEISVILFECIYIALLFAIASCSVYFYHKNANSSKVPFILISALVVFKHVLNLAVSSFVDGYIDTSFDISVTVISIFIDLLQIFFVVLLSNFKCKKHFDYARKMLKASKYLETVEYDETLDVYPFKKFIDLNNVILKPIFLGALIATLILVLQRIYADFIVLGTLQTSFELLDIILSYLTDIFMGALLYVAAYFSAAYILINTATEN